MAKIEEPLVAESSIELMLRFPKATADLVSRNKQEAALALERAAKSSLANLKSYDVLRSRIRYDGQGVARHWWEEFLFVGKIRAYNSVSAMEIAKKAFPQYAERMAVMASAHPLSHSSKNQAVPSPAIAMAYPYLQR